MRLRWVLDADKTELLFLKPQDLGPDDVFDAKGRSIKDVKDEAQGTGKGAGPRRASWLRRTSSTHAARPLRPMQNRNARILQRASAFGNFYIATSLRLNWTKAARRNGRILGFVKPSHVVRQASTVDLITQCWPSNAN